MRLSERIAKLEGEIEQGERRILIRIRRVNASGNGPAKPDGELQRLTTAFMGTGWPRIDGETERAFIDRVFEEERKLKPVGTIVLFGFYWVGAADAANAPINAGT